MIEAREPGEIEQELSAGNSLLRPSALRKVVVILLIALRTWLLRTGSGGPELEDMPIPVPEVANIRKYGE